MIFSKWFFLTKILALYLPYVYHMTHMMWPISVFFLIWQIFEFLVPPREIIDIELEVINVKALDEKYKLEPEITPEEIDQTEYDEFIGVGKYFMTKGKKQVPDKLSLPQELRPVLTFISFWPWNSAL